MAWSSKIGGISCGGTFSMIAFRLSFFADILSATYYCYRYSCILLPFFETNCDSSFTLIESRGALVP